jgi:predicted transcriptional regulator
METIQVVLDKKLLQAANRAARQTKQNRSALIRDALREHLRLLERRERESGSQGLFKATTRPRQIAGLGSGGRMAERIARGDIRLYRSSYSLSTQPWHIYRP